MTKRLALLLATLVATSRTFAAEQTLDETPKSDWSFNLSPYIWVAAVRVETTLDNEPTPPPSPGGGGSEDRYETKLGGGALLAAQVHYKSWGLWADLVWIQTDTSAVKSGPLYSAKDLEANFYHSTIALSYLLPTSDKFRVELLAGARYWSVEATIDAQAGALPSFSGGQEETWITPVIGADFAYDLGPKWSLMAKGTVAVGDHNSDGWEAMGGVTYRFGERWSTTLAYRYLKEEYTRKRFAYFTEVSGVVLGVSYRF